MHALRDGRDVVCSLLERGWLNAAKDGGDDAGLAYGAQPRFWVEPERREEFTQVSDARRCAWAWRRYVEAVRVDGRRRAPPRDPLRELLRLGREARDVPRRERYVGAPLARPLQATRRSAAGSASSRPEQLADVEAEAGPLLAEFGYS